MNLLLIIIGVVLAFAAGYALATLRTQREAIQAKALLEAERKHSDEGMRRQAAALRSEFKAMSVEMMRTQGDQLREQHLHSLEALLTPLGRNIEQFRTQFVTGHASLDRYISELVKQTSALGREADDLAKALKGNNKLQGNWGEAVLANLLATAGLTEGRDYTLQQQQNSEQGGRLIPDVVVHLPEHRNVIIDSKVSLKAYAEYVAADEAALQEQKLKEHVRSVRQHIKELSAKNYAKTVPDSIGYVLMFIPGEAAYVAAVNADPQLPADAYAAHIILINPTNLLMALQLAYNLWQSELQSRSVQEIYSSAEKLYKKFSLFAQNFVKIGHSLSQLQRTYDEAHRQLAAGRGNIVSQLEGWKKKGLNPSAGLPDELTREADDADND
ncbi:MAG: DNA recombination protein RmuC [Alloprevotella sp.]